MADTLPPLVVDGSTLAIPRASATQNGYLSREDYILFSGSLAVPVTSFNTRTGEVVLLEDDVLAALGYIPINKSGDTMTGPLLLPAGNPISSRAAAHKGYVDSSIALAGAFSPAKYFPRTWWLGDFKASGSPATFTGAIANGSRTLTLTSSTHDFAIGQGISIVGAGNLPAVAGTNLLVSRITAIAGAVITIADPALHTVSGQVVKHDDTVALQTAIDTAYAGGGGKIICDAGQYRLNGPLTDFNSIIKFPFVTMYPPASAGIPAAIGIEGPRQSFAGYGPTPTSSSVAVFQTDRIGANSDSCMMSSAPWTNNPNQGTRLTIYMFGLVIRTHDNPQISGLDFGMGGQIILDDVEIDTSEAGENPSQPTHGTFGIRTPREGVGISSNTFNNLYVFNYYIGIVVAETFKSMWFIVARCYYAIQTHPSPSFHPIYGTGQLSECVYGINVTGRASFDMSLDFQGNVSSNWYNAAPNSDIYDPGNNATGVIKYSKLTGFGDGSPILVGVTGGQRLNLLSLDGLGTRFTGPVDLPGPATLGDTDTQNLNASALTLFDGTQHQTVGFGAANSAEGTARLLKVPNAVSGAGERSALWAANAGIEAPLSGSLLTGLRSYWNMSDASSAGAVDSQGVNNLVATGGSTSQTGHVAPGNLALGFNGSGQYLSISNASQTGLDPGNANYTISCWVCFNSTSTQQAIISKSAPSNPQSYLLQYDSGLLSFSIVDTADTYHTITFSSFGAPPINTWIFIVIWYDAAGNTMYGQINNGPVVTANLGGAIPATCTGSFQIGSFAPVSMFLNGRVDAVGFWNRILTA